MKSIKFIYLLILMSQGFVFAQTETKMCDATITNPCIVEDTDYSHSSLRHFRDVSTIADVFQGNTAGIQHLKASGSEQPSEKGWKEIANYLLRNQSVFVLDLRQESHGYLNGRAITLVSDYDWINLGKSNSQSLSDQEHWLQSLRIQKKIEGVLTSKQFAAREFSLGKTVPVRAVKNEEKLVSKLGLIYHRLFVTDHRAPDDSEIDSFLTIVRNAPKNTWFHIHCRGGKGRTSTFLAMYDMLKNADQVSFEEIIARQASIDPYYNLFEVNRGDPYLTPFYEQRILFLSHFYQFAQQFIKGYSGTWSEWKNDSSIKLK